MMQKSLKAQGNHQNYKMGGGIRQGVIQQKTDENVCICWLKIGKVTDKDMVSRKEFVQWELK